MNTLILVDDESGQLDIMKNIILELCPGFQVLCFDNSLNAFNYISSNPVDAVITDIRMPELDGLELSKKISQLNKDIIVAIISAYNDFEYAQEAISYHVTGYLIKPVSHGRITELIDKINQQISEKAARKQHMELLNSQLEHYKPAYIERQLKDWLSGTASVNELSSIQSIFKYTGDGIIIATRIGQLFCGSSPVSCLSDLVAFIKITLHRLFSPDHAILSVVYQEEKLILVSVVVGKKELLPDTVFHNFQLLSQIVREECGSSIVSGTSEIVPAIVKDAPFYVKQALTALDYTFLNTELGLLPHHEIQNMQRIDNTMLYAFQNKLLDRFYLYDRNGIQEVFHSFTSHFVNKGYFLPSNLIQQYFINIVFLARKHVQYEQSDTMIEEINNCYSIDILISAMDEYLANLIILQQKKSGEATQQVVESMKLYIDSHFTENISLEVIADQMHFNPNYIGFLFKQHFGTGFKDYVTGLRIRRAKQLLTETNLKIYEIAEKTGYSDVAYFIKLFKKETGISPNKFRIGTFNKELG